MTWETLDPSISWNLGPGQARFFAADLEQEWTPVLLQIVGISPRQFATGEGMFGDNVAAKAEWQSWVRIPPLYTDLLPALDERFNGLEYITALVKKEFFSLSDEVFKKVAPFVKQIALSPPLSRSSYAEPTPLKPLPTPVKRSKSGPPGNVVVGIIDDGLAIGHERFRKSAGSTRIEYVWVQDGIPPSAFLTEGREIDKASINAWLSASTHAGLVDEEEFYRRAGLADFAIDRHLHRPVAWRRAHGTHVLDVATGAEPGGRPDWPIICVQLPVATVGMPETATLGHYIIYGVWYILLRSLFVPGAALPVVINISYGISDGPHDGTHPIETAIEFIAGLWSAVFGVDVEVVIASGNSYLDRLHAEVTFPSAGSQTKDICWRIQPDDKTDSVVEIWLPYGPPATPNRLEVTLIAPDGSATTALGETGSLANWPPTGPPTLGQVAYGSSAGRSHFRITVNPTAGIELTGPICTFRPLDNPLEESCARERCRGSRIYRARSRTLRLSAPRSSILLRRPSLRALRQCRPSNRGRQRLYSQAGWLYERHRDGRQTFRDRRLLPPGPASARVPPGEVLGRGTDSFTGSPAPRWPGRPCCERQLRGSQRRSRCRNPHPLRCGHEWDEHRRAASHAVGR